MKDNNPYSCDVEKEKVYNFVFKDGFFGELICKKENDISICKLNDYFYVRQFEKNEEIFSRYDIDEMYHIYKQNEKRFYFIKYNSSKIEFISGNNLYKTDSILEITELIKEYKITQKNIEELHNKINDLLKNGKTQLVKHEPSMLKNIYDKRQSMGVFDGCIFTFENPYEISSVLINKFSYSKTMFFQIIRIITINYKDNSKETYLMYEKDEPTFCKYSKQPEELITIIKQYDDSVIKLSSFHDKVFNLLNNNRLLVR